MTKVHTYFDKTTKSASLHSIPQYFPKESHQNKVITVSAENNPVFGAWVVNQIPSRDLMRVGNNLPLNLMNSSPILEEILDDGISDWILEKAQEKYASTITKEDLFHYVYGFLHSPTYRKKYAKTLTKQAPSIPLVDEKSFWQYTTIGKELMDLHLNYENQPKLAEIEVSGQEHQNYTVCKMKFQKGDKSVIIFNDYITISGIPKKAHDYLIEDKSPIWWVMNQYQATIGTGKTAKNRMQSAHYKKDIPNDPNIYAQEIGNPRYILDLLLSAITLSVKTLELTEQLPRDLE